MKYIQSFYQYPVTFSSIAKTIPARNASGEMKNLCEITEAQLDNLQRKAPFFRELVAKKKIRILNHMPESYKTSAARINEANDEIARLKAENEKLRAQTESIKNAEPEQNAKTEEEAPAEGEVIDLDKATYKELQKYASDLGINPNQKKDVLLEEIKAAAAESYK